MFATGQLNTAAVLQPCTDQRIPQHGQVTATINFQARVLVQRLAHGVQRYTRPSIAAHHIDGYANAWVSRHLPEDRSKISLQALRHQTRGQPPPPGGRDKNLRPKRDDDDGFRPGAALRTPWARPGG